MSCKKGMLGLRSRSPLRKGDPSVLWYNPAKDCGDQHNTTQPRQEPQQPSQPQQLSKPQQSQQQQPQQQQPQPPKPQQLSSASIAGGPKAGGAQGKKAVAKYTYNANPNSVLGAPELSTVPKEPLMVLNPHPDNKSWILVRKETGEEGYVPASYVLIEEPASSGGLPWLQEAKVPEVKAVLKTGGPRPFVSAYEKKDGNVISSSGYHCDICNRSFNGPQPHAAHLRSRDHKDEMAARAEYDN